MEADGGVSGQRIFLTSPDVFCLIEGGKEEITALFVHLVD